ncbi:MAG: hypothetical protein SH859_07490 [Hyphomicrobium aestuarii]|nr:hypothetical protein [Hyphomicrobium aestuarii]
MAEFIGSIIVIGVAGLIGAVLLQIMIEIMGVILPYLVYAFVIFVISSLIFGFSAEAAGIQGVGASVAMKVMKAKMGKYALDIDDLSWDLGTDRAALVN